MPGGDVIDCRIEDRGVAAPRDRIGDSARCVLEGEPVARIAERVPDASTKDDEARTEVRCGAAEAIRSSYDDERMRSELVCGQRVASAVVGERPVFELD